MVVLDGMAHAESMKVPLPFPMPSSITVIIPSQPFWHIHSFLSSVPNSGPTMPPVSYAPLHLVLLMIWEPSSESNKKQSRGWVPIYSWGSNLQVKQCAASGAHGWQCGDSAEGSIAVFSGQHQKWVELGDTWLKSPWTGWWGGITTLFLVTRGHNIPQYPSVNCSVRDQEKPGFPLCIVITLGGILTRTLPCEIAVWLWGEGVPGGFMGLSSSPCLQSTYFTSAVMKTRSHSVSLAVKTT